MTCRIRSYADHLSLANITCIPQDPPRIIAVIAISANIDDINGPIIEDRNKPDNRITKMDASPIATVVIIQILFLVATVVCEIKLSFLPGLL
jgi:hypothetical protein